MVRANKRTGLYDLASIADASTGKEEQVGPI